MNRFVHRLFLASLILTLIGLGSGCGLGGVDSRTNTSPLEVTIETPHLDHTDFLGLLANQFVDQGYEIMEQKNRRLTLTSPTEEGLFYDQNTIVRFDLIDLRNQTRILGRVFRVTTSASSNVRRSTVEVTGGGRASGEISNYLKALRQNVNNQDAFEDLTEIDIQPAITGGADTEQLTVPTENEPPEGQQEEGGE